MRPSLAVLLLSCAVHAVPAGCSWEAFAVQNAWRRRPLPNCACAVQPQWGRHTGENKGEAWEQHRAKVSEWALPHPCRAFCAFCDRCLCPGSTNYSSSARMSNCACTPSAAATSSVYLLCSTSSSAGKMQRPCTSILAAVLALHEIRQHKAGYRRITRVFVVQYQQQCWEDAQALQVQSCHIFATT